MTREQKIEAFTMHLDGSSFKSIAGKFGITKQAVEQGLKSTSILGRRRKNEFYPNVLSWMNHNKVSSLTLAKSLNMANATLSKKLNGTSDFSLRETLKLMEVTGLSFSEIIEGMPEVRSVNL
jgi:hypothetical protein